MRPQIINHVVRNNYPASIVDSPGARLILPRSQGQICNIGLTTKKALHWSVILDFVNIIMLYSMILKIYLCGALMLYSS